MDGGGQAERSGRGRDSRQRSTRAAQQRQAAGAPRGGPARSADIDFSRFRLAWPSACARLSCPVRPSTCPGSGAQAGRGRVVAHGLLVIAVYNKHCLASKFS
jgi:hypothetical protein